MGKTTIATGIMGALYKRGYKVQPFKTGPDYIDPTYHTRVTGTPSRNLDTWMLPRDTILELFQRAMRGKDIAIIEGVMGLYDGRSAIGEEGSTAELAKLIKASVLLIVDTRKGARSLAAMVKGYRDFDPSLRLVGVILNGIGSKEHLKVCSDAILHYTGLRVLGYFPQREELTLPERHLGLVPMVEDLVSQEVLERIILQCEDTLDLDGILAIAGQGSLIRVPSTIFPSSTKEKEIKIAVARDKAFSFYYEDNLELLQAWGAEIWPFSPLQDISFPPDISGIYIGGGFPEIYAAELSANTNIKKIIKQASRKGMPLYAECGGLMYLGKSIRDFDENEYGMVGIFPVNSQIGNPRLTLGYRTVKALHNGPLMLRGKISRGHEFHWSTHKGGSDSANAYRILDKGNRVEGFQKNNTLASYVHLHFGSLPSLAIRFIEQCRLYYEGISR